MSLSAFPYLAFFPQTIPATILRPESPAHIRIISSFPNPGSLPYCTWDFQQHWTLFSLFGLFRSLIFPVLSLASCHLACWFPLFPSSFPNLSLQISAANPAALIFSSDNFSMDLFQVNGFKYHLFHNDFKQLAQWWSLTGVLGIYLWLSIWPFRPI